MEKGERAGGKRSKHGYKRGLRAPQIELVKAQCHHTAHRRRALVIFEGRDAAGKTAPSSASSST